MKTNLSSRKYNLIFEKELLPLYRNTSEIPALLGGSFWGCLWAGSSLGLCSIILGQAAPSDSPTAVLGTRREPAEPSSISREAQ